MVAVLVLLVLAVAVFTALLISVRQWRLGLDERARRCEPFVPPIHVLRSLHDHPVYRTRRDPNGNRNES